MTIDIGLPYVLDVELYLQICYFVGGIIYVIGCFIGIIEEKVEKLGVATLVFLFAPIVGLGLFLFILFLLFKFVILVGIKQAYYIIKEETVTLKGKWARYQMRRTELKKEALREAARQAEVKRKMADVDKQYKELRQTRS